MSAFSSPTDASAGRAPLVLIYGDLQGVVAPIGNEGLRDTISMEFLRISGDITGPLTVDYTVTWNSATAADLAANPADANVTALIGAASTVTVSIPFAAGENRVSIMLTPLANGAQNTIKDFRVTVTDKSTAAVGAYVSNANYGGMGLYTLVPGWSGQNSVKLFVLPSTTLFAADNAMVSLRDLNPIPGNPANLANPGININDIAQGYIGNCYFMAAIGAMAFRTPAAVNNIFTPLADGTVLVKIYNGVGGTSTDYNVSMTLDRGLSQAYLSEDFTNNGGVFGYEIWTQVIEKAYAQHVGWENFLAGNHSSWQVWRDLTGQTTSETLTSTRTPAEIEADIRNAVTAGQKIVISAHASTPSTAPTMSTIVAGMEYKIWRAHAYVVKSIDAAGIVELYNPWGFEDSVAKFSIANFANFFYRYQIQ